MAAQVSHFATCTIKDFYESLLYLASKADDCLDIMLANSPYSGKYIDAKADYSEWEKSYDNGVKALQDKFGPGTSQQIINMINKDLELKKMRKKVFG